MSVSAHIHVVRLNELVLVLGVSQKLAKTATESKDRSMEVEFVRELGSQAAACSVHCLVGKRVKVSGACGEVHVELVVQAGVGPGIVVDGDLRLVSLARREETLGVEGHVAPLVYQSRPHETRLGLAWKESDHAAFASGTLSEVLECTAEDLVGGPVGLLALS